MAWAWLLIAGLCEVGFTTCLKLSEGFARAPYAAGFVVFAVASFYFLNQAVLAIPLGTAYAVWTGIGALGTVLIGIAFFDEPAGAFRLACLGLLIASIIGLKLGA